MKAKIKQFDIITIFPEILESYFNESLFKRAQKNKLLKIKTHNLRRWTTDRHQTVDDKPYGGGVGLVFKIEPIYKALKLLNMEHRTGNKKPNPKIAESKKTKTRVILTAANGKKFTQKDAVRLSKYDQLVFVCSRYEGADARVEKLVDEKFSIGDYVVSGGELPAAVMIEAISRHIPGFVGKQESVVFDSHSKEGYLEHPQYTRPEVFIAGKKRLRVPKVLLSGHHGEIERWRRKMSKIS
jgi:tRNA (guanine37-N1)-methyltransferase